MSDNTVKLICHALGCIIVVYLLWLLLPYIVVFLAVCGAGYLIQEHNRNNRGRGGRCR